jgi:flagellar biosynthetic protein FliR
VLFLLDFHLEVVRALVASYIVEPPGRLFDPQAALVDVTDTISQSFYVALRLGSPFVAYAILVNLATGLVNKLTPQIPVYFISLPFVITGGLILMYFAVGNFLGLFADSFLSVTLGR